MRKIIYLFISAFFLHFTSSAATNITVWGVSGHWTEANSPYIVHNNIAVPGGSTLIIDPGVEVVFTGGYSFTATGLLKAQGTAAKPILFHAQDTTNWYNLSVSGGGWAGISIPYLASPDSTVMDYCKIYDVKGGQIYLARPVNISNLEVFHCKSSGDLFNINNYYGLIYLNGGNIHDNYVGMSMGGLNYNLIHVSNLSGWGVKMPGSVEMDNFLVHDNSATAIIFAYNAYLLVLRSNSFFNNCTSDEGVLHFWFYDSAYVLNNKIYDNVTNGMAVVYAVGSWVDITGNFICNNRDTMAGCAETQGGGGIHISGNGPAATAAYLHYTVRNNIIANNYCIQTGGGIYIYHAAAEITNNAIVNNATHSAGPAIGIKNTWNKTIFKNNIFNNNKSLLDSTLKAIWSGEGGYYYFDNNYIDSGIHGMFEDWVPLSLFGDSTHNIVGSNPMFVSAPTTWGHLPFAPLTASFNVLTGSPCINGGDIDSCHPYTYDYIGSPRIQGGKIDIGPYECEGCMWTPPPLAEQTIRSVDDFSVYPNPVSDYINILLPVAKGVITITDITGKDILSLTANTTTVSAYLGNLPRGLYTLTWKQEGHAPGTKKIVLQ